MDFILGGSLQNGDFCYQLYFFIDQKQSINAKYTKIALELEQKYPGHILSEGAREWLFMNAGGWMGSVYVLHASVTEYVLFFGTAVDTQGHSGTV